MRSFSALYYIKENRKRATALIILIATISICYLGGLYVTNPIDSNVESMKYMKDYYIVGATTDDIDNIQYRGAYETIRNADTTGAVIPIYEGYNLTFRSIMDFHSDTIVPNFQSSKDFREFNRIMKIMPEDFVLESGQMIMSDSYARNLGLSKGDTITKEKAMLNRNFTLAATYHDNAYTAFLVDSQINYDIPNQFLVVRKEGKKEELSSIRRDFLSSLGDLEKNYPSLYFSTYQKNTKERKEVFRNLYLIYFAIVGMISMVLAIAVNATFVGAYEKRRYEFSIYKAIGFSHHQISFKIIKEILIINLSGLLLAGLLIVSSVYFINNLLLIKEGLFLKYYKPESLIAAAACDALIVIPIMIARIRSLRKYDVTEY